eukprot:4349725-Pyramimonas_sp.AAC.1
MSLISAIQSHVNSRSSNATPFLTLSRSITCLVSDGSASASRCAIRARLPARGMAITFDVLMRTSVNYTQLSR